MDTPTLLIRADIKRDISARGKESLYFALIFTVIIGIISILTLLILIHVGIVKPITLLTRFITEKDHSGNLASRLPVMRNDEIGTLAQKSMEIIRDLANSKQDLEKLVETRTMELEIANNNLREAKVELEGQNVELKKLDQLKDGLLRDATHELKTPVAKQAMQLELLKRQLNIHGLNKEYAGIIRIMEACVKRQETSIHNFLDLCRLEAGGRKYELKEVRLDQVLEEVLEDYAAIIATENIKLERQLIPLSIVSDRQMLFHVFSNLINNTIKYRRTSIDPYLGIYLEEKNGQAVVRVVDNGIGMDEEENQRAFTKFYQASASAEGSGVGLTIAKLIVEGLGGHIYLESAGRDLGVSATVELPLENSYT